MSEPVTGAIIFPKSFKQRKLTELINKKQDKFFNLEVEENILHWECKNYITIEDFKKFISTVTNECHKIICKYTYWSNNIQGEIIYNRRYNVIKDNYSYNNIIVTEKLHNVF